ncbi:HAMP domain-containing histidine kinase [Clostridium sp. SHJSY1]|uniref:sensor histidine kinase n=1 Tax=Clostridium sp. SHJSY1 TaxID=2942483 RepID=UPI002875BBA8|nr:HAMP domain-containing sensor histidine kinase [Clostridium sp. SHJSY1]MDS0527151.1 HAMP domain-containing histidine kinase [Clostridium sp. SHJSY1]
MEKDERYTEALYIGREKCISSFCLAAIFFVALTILLKDNEKLTKSIITIIVITGASTVSILILAVLKIYEAAYYRIMCLFFIVVTFVNVSNLILNDQFSNRGYVTMYAKVVGYTTLLLLLVITCLRMTECVYETRKRQIIKYIFGAICIVLTNISVVLYNNYGFIQINNLLILFFTYLTRKNLKGFKLINEKRINTMLFINFNNIAISCLSIINIFFNGNYMIFDVIIRMLIFSGFMNNFVMAIDKLLNGPYKVLFGDLYKQNAEMNELNSEVVRKNRELEFSQAIIRKKEKMFKTFFISVPVPLAIVSNKGRVMFINSSFQELVEEDNIKNIINKKIFSIVKSKNDENINELFMKNHSIISGVVAGKKEEKYVDMEFVDISNSDEETLIIFNDVTSKIKIGKLRAEMENNIFQERIKRDFLSNISHDLKTPINVIYSAAQLISVYVMAGNREALKKYNLISRLNCIGLIRLTNNLIDSSRIYSDYLSANMQIGNIVEIVEETITSLIDYAKNKDINLLFDTDEEELFVKYDEEFIQRIVINIVSNAIKFSREGGKIEVIIKSVEDKVKLLIIDNGIGMEEEFIEKAFSRYSMGKNNESRSEKGTGIGLFVVKKLVEKQNGEISIRSKINEGTRIEIEFNKELCNA